MDTKLSFRDFLWVLMAYLRGKVLRQKNYRPHGNSFPLLSRSFINQNKDLQHGDSFPYLPGGHPKRMLAIIDWWGYRPMTMEEILPLRETAQAKISEILKGDLSHASYTKHSLLNNERSDRRNDALGFISVCRKR